MQATVKSITDNGIEVLVRRNCQWETLIKHNEVLRVGQKINVRRQTNNPFVVFVSIVS